MKMGFNSSSASVKFFCGSLKYKDMPRKALITVAAAILLVVLIIGQKTRKLVTRHFWGIWRPTAGLEKDLPTEEKIPTH